MAPQDPTGKELGQAWRYDSLGYTFAGSVILFAGAGYLLDRWLHTLPFLTIAGTLAGAGLAFVWVYLRIRQDEAAWKAEHRPGGARKPEPPPE